MPNSICFWHATVLIICSVSSPLISSPPTDIPRFSAEPTDTYILPSGETWYPGSTTRITAMRARESLKIRIRLSTIHHAPVELDDYHLLYKCSVEDESYRKIQLWSWDDDITKDPSLDEKICSSLLEFQLQQVSYGKYNLTLLNNRVPFNQTLRHAIELRLNVGALDGRLNSSSLYIFNIEPIVTLHDETVTSGGLTYSQFVLTNSAMQLLAGRYPVDSNDTIEVNFLNEEFLDVAGKAPKLIQTLLSVTASVRAVKPNEPCDPNPLCKLDKAIVIFYSGDPYTAKYFSKNPKTLGGHIDMKTGMLMLYNIVAETLSSENSTHFCACVRVSLNTATWQQHAVRTVMRFQFNTPASLPQRSPFPFCKVKKWASRKEVTGLRVIFAGLSSVTIASPFVCHGNQTTVVMQATFHGPLCEDNPNVDNPGAHPSCGKILLVPTKYQMVVLVSTTNVSQNTGELRFNLTASWMLPAYLTYRYDLSVVSPPLFSRWGAVDGQSNEEDMLVTTRCQAYHSTFDSTVMWPAFRVSDAAVWEEVTADEFAIKYLKNMPRFIDKRRTLNNFSSGLEVSLGHINTAWKQIKVWFICRCSIANADALEQFGVAHYETEVGTWIDTKFRRQTKLRSLNGDVARCTPVVVASLVLVVSIFLVT